MKNLDRNPQDFTAGDERKRTVEDIRTHRVAGNLAGAIQICIAAKARWPQDFFFAKILADLHFQEGAHETAFVALADFLALIPPSHRLISDFATRYHRFRRTLPRDQMSKYAAMLLDAIKETKIDVSVAQSAKKIISPDAILPLGNMEDKRSREFIKLLRDDSKFENFVKLEREFEEHNAQQLAYILDVHILNRTRSIKTYRIDLFCVSTYEKLGLLDKALKVTTELLSVKLNSIAIRSLFRICRLKKHYAPADALLEEHPALIRANDFNVLYEFVYYFEFKNDFHMVQSVLRTLDKSFATNIPVLRTVRNFYIRFGLLDEAKRLEGALYPRGARAAKKKYTAEVAETELELYSQLEHQKQLAAISDLTTGISHELGQPITNIRYTIQYHRRLFAKELSIDAVSKVFDSILEETARMGGLIRRLAPLTSSRGVVEQFDVMDRIRKRVEGEEPRLQEGKIKVHISPKHPIQLTGDPVKFDQLVSNLLLNSIDAINERKETRDNKIDILIENNAQEIRVLFSDSGIGIPFGNRNKIFDPFFSTKPPGKGEGLGLFIVWNLLKMLGGRISVDSKHSDGAKFIINIPHHPDNQS
ncbi:sensor histidine kinase [Pararobbsia silviterrae]|uniref:histidine kinase n=1 Tax=Pararobbsia silviterrae TaxID=1792498 RepID=A0A494Y538_9BURK|nr:HAMP domain-containing sensor histidine kinase [Pararobbsia silviterrae]RKP56623.1 sensor histidine kinase [Pararobbsia silviterrae]